MVGSQQVPLQSTSVMQSQGEKHPTGEPTGSTPLSAALQTAKYIDDLATGR